MIMIGAVSGGRLPPWKVYSVSKTMSATEARVHFGAVIRQVKEEDETVIVEHGGQATAAIISIERLRRLEPEPKYPEWHLRVMEAREDMRRRGVPPLDPPAEDVIRAIRSEFRDPLAPDE